MAKANSSVGHISSVAPSHTPGPWSIGTGSRPGSAENHAILSPPVETIIADVVFSSPTHNPRESEANARLIAAAPELLEALKAATQFVRLAIDDNENGAALTLEMSEAAIRKAEGQ